MTEIRGMPSLWAQAAGLAAKGRNGDEMLVHMTPKEVATLSSLMPGGRPTTNPHTGLPEFFGLSDFFSGIGDALGGGGDSGGDFSYEPGPYDGYVLDYDAPGGPAETMVDGGGMYSVNVPGGAEFDPASREGLELVSNNASGASANENLNSILAAGLGGPETARWNTPGAGSGSGNSGIFGQVSDFVRNNRELSTIALIAGLAGLQAYERQQAQNANRAAQRRSIFRGGEYQATPGQEFDARPTRRDVTRPAAGYNPITSGPVNFYQRGAMPQRYAEGGPVGIEALTTGAIRGPGAGMEDKIHGTIDGRREVRLSDGEHVIPADVVSQLGDGSSEAGHKRLSQMIHAVRAEKTGSTRQPPPIDPKRVMPR